MAHHNPQSNNVGNMGDILKHAALIAGIEALLKHGRALTYVDTHAYLLEAPCGNPGRWLNESRELRRQHERYGPYIDLQPRAARRPSIYRCSTGLAIDVVRKLTGNTPTLVIAEKNGATMQRLRQQLSTEGIGSFTLLTQAEDLDTVGALSADSLYALVDPFTLDESLWRTVSPQLSRLAASVRHAAVQLFTYEKHPAVSWPEPPSGLIGPIVTIDAEPFHLAAYATRSVAEDISAACASLGWTPMPEPDSGGTRTQPTKQSVPVRVSSDARNPAEEPLKDTVDRPNDKTDETGAPRHAHAVQVRGFSPLRGLPNNGLREAIDLAVARVVDDPRASLVHQRRFTELIVSLMARARELDLSGCRNPVDRILSLENALGINHHIVRTFHRVRLQGNEAAHQATTSLDAGAAADGLRDCHQLVRWYLVHSGSTEPEAFKVDFVDADAVTPRQQRREEKLRRDMKSLALQLEQQKQSYDELRGLLDKRPAVPENATVLPTVPDTDRLKWVYFATPSRASRANTYDLAYERGIICCDVFNSAGSLKPNVGRLGVGDLILLAYRQDGSYTPELYVQVEAPFGSPIGQTSVMCELPEELAPLLQNGYSPDPLVGRFTGLRVTPCSDWKGHKLKAIKKPTGQNFLRRWDEVRDFNGL